MVDTSAKRQRKSLRAEKRGRSCWAAFGAAGLAAYAVGHPSELRAYPAQNPQVATTGTANAVTFHFEIESGPLGDVVKVFESITGTRVRFVRPDISMLQSMGVRGDFTADRALVQILDGTMVSHRFAAANTIELDLEAVVKQVTVATEAPETRPSSPKYDGPLRNVPQTIVAIPRSVMEQQGAASISDAMSRSIPGITIQAGEGGGASNTAGDVLNLRGTIANMFKDGVRDDGLITRNVYNLEQIEVFLGPTGSDVGRGTAAGYINMVTKTPSLRSSYAATFAYLSGNQSRSTIDLNQPLNIGPSGSWISRAAMRLNGFWQKGGVAGRDSVETDNRSFAPSFSFGTGSKTRVIYAGEFTRQENLPDYGVPTAAWSDDPINPSVTPATSPVRQANYYGSLDYDFDNARQDSHMARIERDFSDSFKVTNQTRYNKTHRFAIVTGIGAFTPATETSVLQRAGNERQNRIVSNQSNATARFSLVGLKHSLSTGLEYIYEDQFAPTLSGVGTRPAVNLFNPDPMEAVTDYAPTRTGALTKGWSNTAAFYAFDTTSIGRLQLNGGFRAERYTTNSRTLDATGTTTVNLRGDGALLSGKAGALFRITDSANVYASYGTTLTPPGAANFTLNAQPNNQNNPNVDPQKSRNIEVGGKWDVFDRRLALTAAVFDTRNDNVIFTVDATATPPIFNQNDAQSVKGLTLSAMGYITPRLNVLATFGYLDSELVTQNDANNGNRLTLTPTRSGSLWATWLMLKNLSVGGGLRYTDTVNVNAANTIKSPGYALADAVIDYSVHSSLSLRLNVYNLTDASYVRNVNNNGNRYNPGTPRSFMITSSVRF